MLSTRDLSQSPRSMSRSLAGLAPDFWFKNMEGQGTMHCTGSLALLGLCTAIALTGCSTSDGQHAAPRTPTATSPAAIAPTAPTPTPTSTPTPTPSPSPSPTAWQSFPPADPTETEDQTAIREGWEEYQRQVDRFAKDPTLKNLTPLTLTTTGQTTSDIVDFIGDLRDNGHVRKGNMSYRDLQIGTPKISSDGSRVVEVSVCSDFTDMQTVVASTGALANAGEGQEWVTTLRASYTMVEQPNGRWVISETHAERETC